MSKELFRNAVIAVIGCTLPVVAGYAIGKWTIEKTAARVTTKEDDTKKLKNSAGEFNRRTGNFFPPCKHATTNTSTPESSTPSSSVRAHI